MAGEPEILLRRLLKRLEKSSRHSDAPRFCTTLRWQIRFYSLDRDGEALPYQQSINKAGPPVVSTA